MKALRIEPEASTELEQAALWYERKHQGLSFEFLAAVDAALEFITHFSQAGSPIPFVPKDLLVKRVPVRRLPFHGMAKTLRST
jgi:hypothetical protein